MTIALGAKVLMGRARIHRAEVTAPALRNEVRRRGRHRSVHAKCPQVVKQTIVARRFHAMTAEPSADVVGAQLKAKKVCALRAIRMDLSLQKAPATVSSLAFVVSGLSPVTLMGATKRAQCTTDTRTHAKRVREKQTAAIAKRAL